MIEDNSWPPIQPKNFIPPLQLIQHAYPFKPPDETENYQSFIGHSICIPLLETHTDHQTKDIMKILASLENRDEPQVILVESTPGIGKSVYSN